MTTVFPLDPEINDIYQGYFWDGEFWKKQGFDSSVDYLEESSASAIYLTQINASATYATIEYVETSIGSSGNDSSGFEENFLLMGG
jgi:hypothetical protein